ncbi:MAG: hypothetical protein KGZ57_04470, partial [Dethiobacter sp.]|nr:hypothetical protein [Dethiobacter sp.]
KDEIASAKDEIASAKDEIASAKDEIASAKDEIASAKDEIASVRATVARIENDHGQKLGALFDGYKLNSEKLDRIEAEVTKHDEIILRRIR